MAETAGAPAVEGGKPEGDADGTELYRKVTLTFAEALGDGTTTVTGPACEGTKLIAPVYDRVFGEGFVSNHLKSDLVYHAEGTFSAIDIEKYPKHLEPMSDFAKRLVDKYGIERLRNEKELGMYNFVWMKRSLAFIIMFMECSFVTMTDKPIYDAACKAYETCLKPFHGIVVSSLVTMAFNLCPTREGLLTNFGFASLEAAQMELAPFLEKAKPVVATMQEVIDSHGCEFPDKAGGW